MKIKMIKIINIVHQLSPLINSNSFIIPDVLKANFAYMRPEAQTFFELSEAERIAFSDTEVEVSVKKVKSKELKDLPIDLYNSLEPLIEDFERKESNLKKLIKEKKEKDNNENKEDDKKKSKKKK